MESQTLVGILDQSRPVPRSIGYARVSTDDQDLSLQIDVLTRQGIPESAIFMDKVSGAKTERPGLTKCLETLRSGDILGSVDQPQVPRLLVMKVSTRVAPRHYCSGAILQVAVMPFELSCETRVKIIDRLRSYFLFEFPFVAAQLHKPQSGKPLTRRRLCRV